jgi:L-alanine-DL-glutamate epimerase-like enolase superfamily enzyme
VRIVRAEARLEELPLTRPYAIAGQPPIDRVGNVIVELETDSGAVGLGAGSPGEHVTGETIEACAGALTGRGLAWLAGRDARHVPALCRETEARWPAAPAARAAVDIALHDLLGQALGVPLCDLLGRAHTAMPTSITIGIKGVDETLAEAVEYVARGFRCLKVKIGDELELDLERLVRLRERVGARTTIRVDANVGYTIDETRVFFERTSRLGIELVEQPVPRDDFRGNRRRCRSPGRRAVAADESLHGEEDALALAAPEPLCGDLQRQAHEVRRRARPPAASRPSRRPRGSR